MIVSSQRLFHHLFLICAFLGVFSDAAAIWSEISLISAVQGNGATSPLVGQVVTVEAIVTGDFQDGDADVIRNLGGFFIQEEDNDVDADLSTSEGIFVEESTVDVNIGDLVQVTGVVEEAFGRTQITATSVVIVNSANTLPTAAIISFPTSSVIPVGDDYIADLEQYEGMLVNFPQALQINEMYNLDRFNEIKVVQGDRPFQYTQLNAPDSIGYDAHLQDVASRQITYDDGLNTQNQEISNLFGFTYNTATAKRMGDTVTQLSGVLDYSFSQYRVRSVADGDNTFVQANPRPLTPAAVGGAYTISSVNVLNFFKTTTGFTRNGNEPRGADSAQEFQRQLDKLVLALSAIDADIFGLVEIENDFLAGSSGNAVEFLVDTLNSAGAGPYMWVYPGSEYVGGDAIANALIYKSGSFSVSEVAVLDSDAFVDPNNIGPRNRPAVTGTFTAVTGGCVTVAVNHLKSKGSPCGSGDDDTTGGSGNCNDTRTKAAQELVTWLSTHGSCDAKAIIGDLNAYAEELPIKTLETNGYTDLEEEFLDASAYSFVFDGQIGTLDYIMANSVLLPLVTGATTWHINADEADAIDYNLDFGRNPNYYDGSVPFRFSDHDPIVVGILLTETPASSPTPSPKNSSCPNKHVKKCDEFCNDNKNNKECLDKCDFQVKKKCVKQHACPNKHVKKCDKFCTGNKKNKKCISNCDFSVKKNCNK